MLSHKGQFYRDTWVEIDLDCIIDNMRQMKKRLTDDVEIIAVMKANGYGHGDSQVAKTVLQEGASYLAVAFLDEALSLRMEGIQAPILVLGATRAEDVNIAANNNIILTVFQKEWLSRAMDILEDELTISVHVKLDTGMGRIGVRDVSELRALEKMISEDRRIQLDGAYTHFATADEIDTTYYEQQQARFLEMLAAFTKKPRLIHASNSASSLRNPDANFNGIRFGIGMYGLTPSLEMETELPFPLRPSFSLYSKLINVKKLLPGDKVSYGATYEAQREEWIGTLPIGYADGWTRKLQGQEVLVGGQRAEIVGRICMDQCMIRLPYEMPIGTRVTLIGQDGKERISVEEIANRLDTINYEVTCMISTRVPRVYRKAGEIIEILNFIA